MSALLRYLQREGFNVAGNIADLQVVASSYPLGRAKFFF